MPHTLHGVHKTHFIPSGQTQCGEETGQDAGGIWDMAVIHGPSGGWNMIVSYSSLGWNMVSVL